MADAPLRQILLAAWGRRGWLAWLLWPLSQVYRALLWLRARLYRSGLRATRRVRVPVIVVGNVIAGGAGKTPLVIALTQHLQSRGWHPGVVARGYGRRGTDCRAVTRDAEAADVGDEPHLIHRRTGVPVQVGPRRAAAAQALLEQHPQVDVLICDDGLQHLGLHRNIEICVFDDRAIGNGFLLPAGPLREPWPRPVDLLVRSGAFPAGGGFRITRALAPCALRIDGSAMALDLLAGCSIRAGRAIDAVAGIAQPQAFFSMLRQRGLALRNTWALPDHAPFDRAHWSIPTDQWLLCTEKDAAKLWRLRPDALAVPLQVTLEPAFWQALDRLLGGSAPPAGATPLSSGDGHTPA